MILTERTKRVVEPPMFITFAVQDSKGREFGARVGFAIETFDVTSKAYGHTLEPGTYYTWTPSATRGGEHFGASQATRYCATSEERHSQVTKYFANARKRALAKLLAR